MTEAALPRGKYFAPEEMRCRDGTEYPLRWFIRLAVLWSQLDVIRETFGSPLVIVSGYRSPAHNRSVGGAGLSQHVEGRAVDLRPWFRDRRATKHDVERLHGVIEHLIERGKLPAVGGIGDYPLVQDGRSKLWVTGWVHVDIRPKPADGHVARWHGEGLGSEA